jgi:hypothetical protein
VEVKKQVRVIADEEFPGTSDWMFVRMHECLQFWIRESVAWRPHRLQTALEQAWAVNALIEAEELMSWPEECRVDLAC